MRLRIYHRTQYVYSTPAKESYNEARLMPVSDADQVCLDFRLAVTPSARVFAYDLPTGRVHHFNVRPPHDELIVQAEALVVTHVHNPFVSLRLTEDDSEFYTRPGVRQRYAEYLAPTDRVPLYPEMDRIARVARRQGGANSASFLIALTRLLNRVMTYVPGSTHVNTPLSQALELKQGVCQDFAHLMLGVCRRAGVPARYVSGYLYTGQNPAIEGTHQAQDVESPALLGGNAMHAWVECLLPDEKWHGFDPTNNLLTQESYVKVHYGRDYGDVLPISGVYRGSSTHTLEYEVHVYAEEMNAA